ncbi:MAG: hypothetical protein ONB44_01270 [candidate division KSB1 bacterium]|nr:hypothetical protein [candidate division KSB1 bacterium]MDZ7300751.1 hypothetical protein [candidate division KSB1 bacterium]MDZ7309979.1 hypothetical protein [candidate division KSB1 bacterium]
MWKKCDTGITACFLTFLVISCTDHGLEPVYEGISGKITFIGTWPDSTEWVRLAVFKEMPATVFDIPLKPPVFSDTLPRFVTSTNYRLTLSAGHYDWVVLAWKPKKKIATSDFSGLDTLGMYADAGNPKSPRGIDVPPKRLLTGIDIVADFSVLQPPSPILP